MQELMKVLNNGYNVHNKKEQRQDYNKINKRYRRISMKTITQEELNKILVEHKLA
ncbi:hypothetical protein qdsa001_188 [Staphylococcus phage qdsa001]|nr:hypothetical protein qdsa001_188 [Staphylococcus phage qdsa001]